MRAYDHETRHQLGRQHVAYYLAAHDFTKHLKALQRKTPYETIRVSYESIRSASADRQATLLWDRMSPYEDGGSQWLRSSLLYTLTPSLQ